MRGLGEDGYDFFKNIVLHFHSFEFGAQLFDFRALRAAGHCHFEGRTLPTAWQRKRNALGTGHISLPAPPAATWRTRSALKAGVYFLRAAGGTPLGFRFLVKSSGR